MVKTCSHIHSFVRQIAANVVCAGLITSACFSTILISLGMKKRFRLKVVGFLQADLPYWYFDLSEEMCTKMRLLTPIMPDKQLLKKLKFIEKFPKVVT